ARAYASLTIDCVTPCEVALTNGYTINLWMWFFA
ncbi:MAG: hypothetical protein ACI9Y8_001654, partial [Candidatus Omnitrophota bacterium]